MKAIDKAKSFLKKYRAFVKDNITEEILIANYFEEDIYEVLRDLFAVFKERAVA